METSINKSDEIKDLAGALAKAQGEMHNAAKSAKSHHGKYADLAEVMDALREPFSKNELAISQLVGQTEAGAVSVTTILMHSSGQWIASCVVMTPTSNRPQDVGIIISYARRYGVSAITGLASEEDTDGNEKGTAEKGAAEKGSKAGEKENKGSPAKATATKDKNPEEGQQPSEKTTAMLRSSIREQIKKIKEDPAYKGFKNEDARDAINSYINASDKEYNYEVGTVDDLKPEHLAEVFEHLTAYKKWLPAGQWERSEAK